MRESNEPAERWGTKEDGPPIGGGPSSGFGVLALRYALNEGPLSSALPLARLPGGDDVGLC